VNNLVKRALTGIVFVSVLLGAILISPWAFGALFLIITIFSTLEFYKLSEKEGIIPQKMMGLFLAASLFITNFLYAIGFLDDIRGLMLNVVAIFVVLIIELFKKTTNPFTNIAFTLLGLIYVALPFSLMCYIALFPGYDFYPDFNVATSYTPGLLIGFFVILWANDTGAYLIGSMIGKHKLFKRVSPNKSWEGSIGGALTSVLVGFGMSFLFDNFDRSHWLVMSGIIAVTGGLGDLVQSRLKRSINIKDSGNFLPGHGGFLDRFDATLLAAPFVLTYIMLSQ